MKSEIKAKWVTALRSGEYTQGRGQLRTNDNKFCCLGVLCDIHSRETETPWTETDHILYDWSYRAEDLVLPEAVVKWAGLESGNPALVNGDCSQHNDGAGVCSKSFSEIADLIEANL